MADNERPLADYVAALEEEVKRLRSELYFWMEAYTEHKLPGWKPYFPVESVAWGRWHDRMSKIDPPVPADMDDHTLGELRLMRDIAANFELWDNVAELNRRIAQRDGFADHSEPETTNNG